MNQNNSKILFVDDQKSPEWYNLPIDTHIARTLETAVNMWETGDYNELWLDHDMGASWYTIRDGSHLLDYICDRYTVPISVKIITWNPVGLQRIIVVCKKYDIKWEFSNYNDASLI